MAQGKVDRRTARQRARSPLLWSERDWRRRRRRGLVREAVLDGRKLGPERARQQRRRRIGIPRKFSAPALRARACLYVSSVQETSRCCNLPERRKRERRRQRRSQTEGYFTSYRAASAVRPIPPPALRPPPARPPPPNQSRLHSVLQWSTFAVVVIASSVGQGLTALPRHFESS